MNTIALTKRYSNILNEIYQAEAKSNILETDSGVVRQGNGANEIVIPSISMDGLADYSRNSGYVHGNVKLTWSTVRFNYERGRLFMVDDMDNEETQDIAFGKLAGEFMRTRVVPEVDAFRFAQIINTEDIGLEAETLNSGASIITSLRKATNTMDEAEVPESERILFVSPTMYGMIQDMDTYKSKLVLERFSNIISVPSGRFYASVSLNDGTTSGEESGGYEGEGAVNYLVVHKPAVLCHTKHEVSKIITPEANQTADGWIYAYRTYGLTTVMSGKEAGIYCSMAE